MTPGRVTPGRDQPPRGKATRLYPLPPREIPAAEIYDDLELPPAGRREISRPYVIVNMVSTLDGKTTIAGKSSRIGSKVDRQVMRILRSKADAVLIGANTLRSEKLSLGLDRSDGGPQPLAVIVTSSGELPLETNLILGEGQELLVISPEGVAVELPPGRGRTLSVPAEESGSVALERALATLRTEYAVELLLVEGGPSLNYSLISEQLVDELFLTLAPRLLGGEAGEALTILEGTPLPASRRSLDLLSAYLAGDELFLRYATPFTSSAHTIQDTT